jgi:hypothetical protein
VAVLEQSPPTQWLDLVIELRHVGVMRGNNRSEAMARMQREFQAIAAPVKSAIVAAGGSIEGELWLNSTIMCHVPASAVKALGATPEIVRIDLPSPISRDR